MLRIPGGDGSLLDAKAQGADVRVVYSPLDALRIARDNPTREVVFFAIGFETTAPSTALTLMRARSEGLTNFSVFCNHVTIVPPVRAILESPDLRLDGFLGPGHVSVVVGCRPFEFIPAEWNRPIVIAGFEPVDVLQAIYQVLRQLVDGRAELENQYSRVVPYAGNPAALRVMSEVFTLRAARGGGRARGRRRGRVRRARRAEPEPRAGRDPGRGSGGSAAVHARLRRAHGAGVPRLGADRAAGVVFGTAAGTALSVLGASLGAAGAYLVGRRLGRDTVAELAGDRFEQLDGWLARRGFVAVLYARLIPIVPFNLLNYAAGVTGVRFRDYLAATVVGIVPGTFAFAALGGSFQDPTSPAFPAAVGLIVALAVAGPMVQRRSARRDRGTEAEPDG